MLQYILESIAFQLLFLVIYDFFLKRETFFQWNRVYLLGTYALSMLLPWIKIEALKNRLPQQFNGYSEFLWNLKQPETEGIVANAPSFDWTWQEMLLYGGMMVATLILGHKLWQLYQLKRNGKVIRYADFTQIVIANSTLAFSFFKSIFLGDKVVQRKHDTIIAHELVHIQQGHTWDLLFFELMRIIGWFNPLVYVYQNRTAELHEFIADAQVAKVHKTEHYQQLLSQVFQTEHISFINQFFTNSLIKKRIVMLQKTKSKKVWQLKYVLLVPMVLGMLIYNSCEMDKMATDNQESTLGDELLITEIKKEIAENNLNIYYLTSSGLADKYNNPEKKLTKYEFFKYKILQGEMLEEVRLKFIKEYPQEELLNVEFMQPSTEGYNNFVNEKKAYSLIDGSIKASITAYEKDITYYDKTMGYPNEFIKFEVADVKKVTVSELKKFNELLSGLEDEPYHLGNIILHDDNYAFKIYTKVYKEPLSIQFATEEMIDGLDLEVPFKIVDEVPVFPGCENADDKRACFNNKMQEHIGKNFNYPSAALEAGIQGRVSTMFIITADGTIENIKMRGPDKLLEDEVERIIKRLPNMTPGKNKGVAINVLYAIPVNFKLQ